MDEREVSEDQCRAVELGTVVFAKDDLSADDSNDIWDDRALIRAYDRAVQQANVQMNSSQKKNRNKTKRRRKSAKQRKATKQWCVGDECEAVYTEDNQLYPAVILEILDGDVCLVRYTDYGNEEEHYIRDLRPPSKHTNQTAANMSVCSESTCLSMSGSEASTPQRTHHSARPRHGVSSMGIPSFVPPPPPSLPDTPCNSDEAFHSMLIAWYMSGYHTGYYQGLRDGQKTGKHGNRKL